MQLTFAAKINLPAVIKVAAVSYLNTKPLLYGIERSESLKNKMDLVVDFPSNLAASLQRGEIDVALLPVAAMASIEGAQIISNYGIAADGKVASVCIFSEVPIEDCEAIYLDYQSRTSVRLAELLLKEYWKKELTVLLAPEDYIDKIEGKTAGVIIGDRALESLSRFPYAYDLSAAWKDFTGLPFVFAAWVSNKELPDDFIDAFDLANAAGLEQLDAVIAENPFAAYDLKTYYTENIAYHLDAEKNKGLQKFLELIGQ